MHVRRRCRCRRRARLRSPRASRSGRGPHGGGGRRQGGGGDGPGGGARVERARAPAAARGRRDPLRARRGLPSHRGHRSGASSARMRQAANAADRILGLANGLGPEDLLLCLVSGGGSALLVAPAPGVSLDDKQAINRALLASGANITEMNTVRKHLSRIKGGRLATASHPARCHAVLLLRRSGRRAGDHRVRTDGGGPDDGCGCPRGRGALRACRCPRPSRLGGRPRSRSPRSPATLVSPEAPWRSWRAPSGPWRRRRGWRARRATRPSYSATRSRARRARWRLCTRASPARRGGGDNRVGPPACSSPEARPR